MNKLDLNKNKWYNNISLIFLFKEEFYERCFK